MRVVSYGGNRDEGKRGGLGEKRGEDGGRQFADFVGQEGEEEATLGVNDMRSPP